jgi:hypothetical protein
MPDDQLFAQADANKLGTAADIEGQVRRMLGDPKAAQTIACRRCRSRTARAVPKQPPQGGTVATGALAFGRRKAAARNIRGSMPWIERRLAINYSLRVCLSRVPNASLILAMVH